jgi:excisionase family DNA binding protein
MASFQTPHVVINRNRWKVVMADRYLTTEEVAERFHTNPVTVRYWRNRGFLPLGTRFGRRVLYHEDDLDAWERERRAEGAVPGETAPAV